MGIAALNFAEGKDNITMKLLLLTVFATVGLAISESEPEAKPGLAYLPYYGYYGYYPYYHYKGLGVAAHPTGTSWTQRSVQFRRKRSPDAPVFPSIEGVFGTPHNSAVGTTTRGFPRAKRSAEANVALPPPAFGGEVFGATHNSWVGPTTWGFPSTKAKRSAEPEANPGLLHYPYFYHPLPVVYAIKPLAPASENVFGATHNSAVGTTTWGFPSTKAKRSAEANVPLPDPTYGDVFGATHNSWVGTTTWGFPSTKSKRSADPEANPGLFHYPYFYHPLPVVYAIKPLAPASENVFGATHNSAVGTTTWGFPSTKAKRS